MRAEREKRAAVLNAEGQRQAKILTAEGEKQSAILRAEGEKRSAVLRAEGQAEAIGTVFQSIHDGNPDPKVLAYQYLQMLPQLAQGQGNTFWVIPSEFTSAMKTLSSAFDSSSGDNDSGKGSGEAGGPSIASAVAGIAGAAGIPGITAGSSNHPYGTGENALPASPSSGPAPLRPNGQTDSQQSTESELYPPRLPKRGDQAPS
jgi:hypothetical protein